MTQLPSPLRPSQTLRQSLRLPRVLRLWHLTSLDAPTVACVWTLFVARTVHAQVLPAELAAMFLAVWMIYASDRLLDVSSAQRSFLSHAHLEPRHLFHLRHRRGLLALLAPALILLGLLLTRFPGAEIVLDLALFAMLAAWFLLIHRIAPSLRLPKELALGFFFPAAVFVPALFHHPDSRFGLIVPALLFGFLCALNGLFIHRWEALPRSPTPRIQPEDALTYRLLRNLHPLTVSFCLGAAAAALLLRGPALFLCLAASVSAAGLLALDRWQERFEATDLRALADLALLSPLLLTPWLR